MARFQAGKPREPHGREMSLSRQDDDDEVLSDVEPLPPSALRQSSLLTRSWPSSPLSASREVTARLYSSLQHSREQGVRGHTAARQVSFISSPDLTAVRAMAATPPLVSHGLKEAREAGHTVDSSSNEIGSGVQEVESEDDGLSQEMDLHLRKSLNRSAQITSGRRHIKEMENVRTHLQSILRSTSTAPHRHEFGALRHLLDESPDSDSTSHLLSGAVSLGEMDELFPLYSRLHVDASCSVSELQVLKDSLERERSRRTVCEQQVVSLQNKILQVQQQFTLAVAADRKKDIMIEQLDKTLVKVVEGWRRHDQDRSDEMKLLQEEKQKAETTFHKQKEALSRVEETLNKEQKRNQELLDTNKKLEQQVSELRERVENLQRLEQKLNSDVQRERERLQTLQTESHNTQTHLQELQRQITHTTQQLERERSQVKQEVILREEAQSRSQQLQGDLEEIRRERDSLRVDRTLEQARFESLKSQMEAEFRLSLEQKLNDHLSVIQEENRMLNTQLREQHRKQLLDLSARHERDLSTQLDQFRTQLQEKDLKLQQLTQHYQNKLSEKQEELVSMAASNRRLEMQREELVSRLQGMMRSHWAEALRLLTNQEQIESMFVPPLWEASKISCYLEDTSRSATHPPGAQAVVLNLSRERETHSHSDVLNSSNLFTPLEPVMDHTHLTAVSDCSALWVNSEEGGNSTERKMRERYPNHSQSRANHSHAFTETCTNHSSSSDSGLTRGGASEVLYSNESEKAPPTKEEALPSIHEDRQCELQYYVSKLLERSPGDPLEEPIREQRSADITDPLCTHTTQQLQSRSGDGGINTVRSNLEHKSDDKTEVCGTPGPLQLKWSTSIHKCDLTKVSVFSQRAGSRVVQIRRPVGRRGGSQRVWR